MFGISGVEFALIFIVVLIVVGPKQLPDVLRAVGRLYRKLNLFIRKYQQIIDDTLYDSERLADKAEKMIASKEEEKKDD